MKQRFFLNEKALNWENLRIWHTHYKPKPAHDNVPNWQAYLGFFAYPPSSHAWHEGGHLKYRIITSKVGKRIRGNDFMRYSLA